MALFDAVQRRAGLLDFKQPLQPPRRGYSDDRVGAGRYLALIDIANKCGRGKMWTFVSYVYALNPDQPDSVYDKNRWPAAKHYNANLGIRRRGKLQDVIVCSKKLEYFGRPAPLRLRTFSLIFETSLGFSATPMYNIYAYLKVTPKNALFDHIFCQKILSTRSELCAKD